MWFYLQTRTIVQKKKFQYATAVYFREGDERKEVEYKFPIDMDEREIRKNIPKTAK